MMLMSRLPTASHLQDQFAGAKLRASGVLHERIRTRVLQGAGRCTHGRGGTGDCPVSAIMGHAL